LSLLRLTVVNSEADFSWIEATVQHRLDNRFERRIAQLSQLVVTQIDVYTEKSEIHCNKRTTNELIIVDNHLIFFYRFHKRLIPEAVSQKVSIH